MTLDNRYIKRRGQPLLTHRIKVRFVLFKERYINLKTLVKIVVPLILSFLLLPFLLFFSVYQGYQERIIRDDKLLPTEITTGVGIVDPSSDSYKETITTLQKMYFDREISKIYLFKSAGGDGNIDLTKVSSIIKDIPPENIVADNSTTDIYSICDKIQNEYKTSKFIILGRNIEMIRTTYICNFKGVYTVGFQAANDSSEPTKEELTELFRDILKINFNI